MRTADSRADVAAVRDHYDRISVFYRAFWGEHIHHGYWEEEDADLPRKKAQVQLIEKLVAFGHVPSGGRVLDVGCGVGGSARWLAQHHGCIVDGITLSPVQAQMATETAEKEGLADKLHFRVHDAHHLDMLEAGAYDSVWVVECSEHLGDRAAFLQACAHRLRPGGTLALTSWLRGSDSLDADQEALLASLCEGMICPPLSTAVALAGWMQQAGFEQVQTADWTPHVARTWDKVARIARRPEVRAVLAVSDGTTRRFAAAFPAMVAAYVNGAMRYGAFSAVRS